MALSSPVIYIKRGGNAPPVTITFNDAVLTGSAVEMVLTPTNGAPAVTISTDDDELALSLPSSVVWTYSEDRADGLPSGARTLVDFWRVLGDVREAIGSGVVHVLKAGEAPPSESISITVPGMQGPPGAAGEPLLLVVSDATDIDPGGWWLTNDYHASGTFSYLRAEMLLGTADGVSLTIERNGVPFGAAISLDDAAPTIVTDLGLSLAEGDSVSVHRASGGTITGPWMMLVQIDGRE